ncbi:hypothetical protein NIES80_07820 [Dolichospermum planctonicum]|uniref:Uncharacterized protein n=1 Tax=Dolichospermum planctonicum TaxID=136072 RepID=A0A480AD78_9CYAN|nr:hypothetical protein NIES80_07820 [Dolichospermum planctonicum]
MKFDWSSYLEVAKTLYHEAISTSNQAKKALKCAERINRLLEKIKK